MASALLEKGTEIDTMAEEHIPVLLQEVVEGLQPRPGGSYIDATVGGGGHAKAILAAAGAGASLLGLDADPQALAAAHRVLEPFGDNVLLVESNFRHLRMIAEELGFTQVEGILLDLGLSGFQLRTAGRGFSFQADEALDMRFSPAQRLSAADIVNTCPEQALADVIFRYGEEPNARRIARRIVASRPVHTTGRLAQIIAGVAGRRGKIHPATRTFQALRIAVNDELTVLREVLPQAVDLLASGGRLAVISFHSLEDRIVKAFFQTESRNCICPPETPVCVCGHAARVSHLFRRARQASEAEIARNPQSRSARLRIVVKR